MKTQMLRWQDGNGMSPDGALAGAQFVFDSASLLRDAAVRSGLCQRAPDAKRVSGEGRRFMLNQREEEEIEAVLTELENPPGTVGFYSYGEIGPGGVSHGCELHNQTKILTIFAEHTS